MTLATIVSFCTHDYRFFKKCIEAVCNFSNQIIVPICDHFYDGTVENLGLLESLYREFPSVEFIEFTYDPERLYGTMKTIDPQSPEWGPQWHNTARLIGYYHLKKEIDAVLFCDVDEIIEREKFTAWLKNFNWDSFDALRFSTFWYFREAKFQAKTYPDGPLLVKRNCLSHDLILNEDERMGLYLRIKGKKQRLVNGLDGSPMVHHYSWVRTKEELLQKAQRWAHHWERDWPKLIEEEYAREFQNEDFVRKYQYQLVEPYFDPLSEESPQFSSVPLPVHQEKIKQFPQVRIIDAKEIERMELRNFIIFN